MKRLQRILVHVRAGDETAAPMDRVESLAAHHDAMVFVVDVVPRAPWYARLVGQDAQALAAKHRAERLQTLEAAVAARPGLAQRAKVEVRVGEPSFELTTMAQTHQVDLIVTAGHSHGPELLGRVESQLLRKAPCPVWILRRVEPERWRRVLVAVKPDPDNPVGLELSRELLEAASQLAIEEDAELHVLRVWGTRLERVLRRRMRPDRWQEVRTQLRKDAHDQLLGLLEPWHDQIGGRIWLRQGDPETVIPAFVEKKKIDLLVIGTVARSGLEGVFIGNVAERVFETVKCSILTLKPPGFVSPLKTEAKK
jgi:nucleotide-binding universal stress UspA family protein